MNDEHSYEASGQSGLEYWDRTQQIPFTNYETKLILAQAAQQTGRYDLVVQTFEVLRGPYRSRMKEFLGLVTYEPAAVLTYASTLFGTEATQSAIDALKETRGISQNSDMLSVDLAAVAIAHGGDVPKIWELYLQIDNDPELKKESQSTETDVTLTSVAATSSFEAVKGNFLNIVSALRDTTDSETKAILTVAAIAHKGPANNVIDNWQRLKDLQRRKQFKLTELSDHGLAMLTLADSIRENPNITETVDVYNKFFLRKKMDGATAVQLTASDMAQKERIAVINQGNYYSRSWTGNAILYFGKYK